MKKVFAAEETNALPLGPISGPGAYDPAVSTSVSPYTSAVEKLLSNILAFLSIVGGLMFLIYFLLGGLNWITAGGDQGKVDMAKKYMTGAAIGLIVIALSYSISYIVSRVTGINILNPGATISTFSF